MYDLRHISIETLKEKRKELTEENNMYENQIVESHSMLFGAVMNFYIKRNNKMIHAIEAEIAFRNFNH